MNRGEGSQVLWLGRACVIIATRLFRAPQGVKGQKNVDKEEERWKEGESVGFCRFNTFFSYFGILFGSNIFFSCDQPFKVVNLNLVETTLIFHMCVQWL